MGSQKIDSALSLLRAHRISYRKAAEMAGISYMEMWDLAAKHGIDIGLTPEEVRKDAEKWLK